MPDFPELMATELGRARRKNSPFRTRHEGLAVIEEEFLELRAEVFRREPHREKLLEELVQVAAMCQRFAEDLLRCPYPLACEEVPLVRVIRRLRQIDDRYSHLAGCGAGLGGPLEAAGKMAAEVHDLLEFVGLGAPLTDLPPGPSAANTPEVT